MKDVKLSEIKTICIKQHREKRKEKDICTTCVIRDFCWDELAGNLPKSWVLEKEKESKNDKQKD